jgi:NAD(P)-dependent dehydrogenase (short-subunit alcohol dehydrogenase family)
MSGRFDGRVIYLTGGGSGLGRALVERFVAEGATVSVLDRSAEKNRALREAFGDAIVTTEGDVRDPKAHVRAVGAALELFGRLDVYITNAAIWDGNVSLLDLPPERIDAAFDEVFGVNVKGALLGAKAAAPALVESRGSMIFTLSIAALRAGGGGPLYTSSKTAGIGLVRELAFELAPFVRVNGVAPATVVQGSAMFPRDRVIGSLAKYNIPYTDGEATESLVKKLAQFYADRTLTKAPITPADQAEAYFLLVSQRLSKTTGQIITVDGGLHEAFLR